MSAGNSVVVVVGFFMAAKWAVQLWLERLNRAHVLAHAGQVPAEFKDFIDAPAYTRSIEYTLAKSRLRRAELTLHTIILAVVLFSGALRWAFQWTSIHWGSSAWSMAGFLFLIALALSLPDLPLDWYAQFRLEERFGFNRTSQKLWWTDRLKGLLLAGLLGYPLLLLVLKLVQWTGEWWWLWAWLALLAFQFLMAVLAPVVILPLFNKFSALPEGSLRDRLLRLAEKTRFQARSIQLMDGSKRSRHSNAFFTGFGRFRKIVLFDTLVQQLEEPELEAVLAHEIGHYKKRHIAKMLAASALGSLAGLWFLSWLAGQVWFYRAFGFEPGSIVPALLVFGLLAGVFSFWISPFAHWWSRRYEYQADAFAAQALEQTAPLIGALRKLNKENLSNLTPHPWYGAFYYSHPTPREREAALARFLG